MSAVLLAGIGLLILGAVVLLRFPDRPGGKIAWHGMEVTSTGAGLPLLALGLVCVVVAGPGVTLDLAWLKGMALTKDAASEATQSGDCFGQYLRGIPRDRIATVETGTHEFRFLGPHQPAEEAVGLTFTEDGKPAGAMRFQFFSANQFFKIETIVDTKCEPSQQYANVSRGGDRQLLQNWDTVRMQLQGKSYDLRLGYDAGEIEVAVFTRVTP